MRGSFQTLIRAAAFLACVLSFAHADELDQLLSQPPSASVTPEDAQRRIDLLRNLAASHPDRADEIEAYLIPFVRVTQPPPSTPAPTPAPAPATAKPLLLVRSPDGSATAMRALSRTTQGDVMIIVGESGSRAVLQAATLMGELKWYTDEELESGAVDLERLAASYEAFANAVPALRRSLDDMAVTLRDLQKAKERKAEEAAAAIEARVTAVTGDQYDAGAGYTAQELARKLLDAESLRDDLPQFSARIDAWAVPFRAHFARLLSGFSYVNGEWMSNADLARKAYEQRRETFLKGLDYRLRADALPAGAVRGMVVPIAVKCGIGIVAGLAAVVLGWRRIVLRMAGAALVALTVLASATVFFLATRNPALLPGSMPLGDARGVVTLLSQAAGLEQPTGDTEKISDADLNGFLVRHVRIDGAGGEAGRQAVAARFLPGRIVVFEMVRSMGLSWILQLDLSFQQTASGSGVALMGAKLGALNCPREFAAALWSNLEPQFATILTASKIGEIFDMQPPVDSSMELKPKARDAAVRDR